MAKQYRKQNGLILPDDSITVPKPDLPRPWYAGRITANRAMSRRKCCCGVSCDRIRQGICTNLPNTSEWIVDFGAGGWTATTCSDCSGVQGSFVLSYTEVPFLCIPAYNICAWKYTNVGSTCTTIVILGIESVSATTWHYFLSVVVEANGYNPCGNYDGSGAFANFYSSTANDGDSCLEPVTDGVLTLTKDWDYPSPACDGSLPASITATLNT